MVSKPDTNRVFVNFGYFSIITFLTIFLHMWYKSISFLKFILKLHFIETTFSLILCLHETGRAKIRICTYPTRCVQTWLHPDKRCSETAATWTRCDYYAQCTRVNLYCGGFQSRLPCVNFTYCCKIYPLKRKDTLFF